MAKSGDLGDHTIKELFSRSNDSPSFHQQLILLMEQHLEWN